ncbi:NrsF family protein [Hydrogenophaga atypica]|uniref:NrsF family protein n=1 Tax=Hydrogenophaga atypica TaxID=249409 RepID=A0ABW2QDV2_9BURK
MKTDELIGLLATDTAPVPRQVGERRLVVALGAGVLLGVAWVLAQFGLRGDLAQVAGTAPFALKVAMPLAVAALGAAAVFRLGHPGMRLGALGVGLGLPVLLLWLWAVWVWAGADPTQRDSLLWGSTWRVCSSNVAITALPMLALALWYLRGLAPTRPGWAGAAAGWLAGGVGAAAYALHCPEMDAPFLAVWYVLGMLVPTALGALIGSRVLRW